MMNENIRTLVTYRMEQAEESLESAALLFEKNLFRPAVNRAYYTMFYAVLALLATLQIETSKHAGVISLFDKEFVKQGKIAKNFSKWLHHAFDIRQSSDYRADYTVTKDETRLMVDKAGIFFEEIRNILKIY